MALLIEIENFLDASGMSPTAFGSEALNDPPFVSQLRQGRDVKVSTADRVRAFIQAYRPNDRSGKSRDRDAGRDAFADRLDFISSEVIGEAIRIHRELGPGLLESVYEMVLAGALARLGYKVDRQRPINVTYDGMTFNAAFKLDIIIEDSLVLEIKSIERLNGAHAKQLLTYLRLLKQPLGLLLNFSGETMKEGIRRVVNNHRPID